MKTQLITINPCFFSQLGHNFYYLKSVEKACESIGWNFSAILPKKNLIENLPAHWVKSLDCPILKVCYELVEKKPYKRPRKKERFKQRLKYYYSLAKSLKAMSNKDQFQKRVLFYEAFSLSDIQLVLKLLKILRLSNTEVWLMMRYPHSFYAEKELCEYKKLIAKAKAGHWPLKLVADTELLAVDLSEYFDFPVTVFPIPMTQLGQPSKTNNDSIICWWPGVVRADKGLDIIQQFAASENATNSKITLVAAESAHLTLQSNGPKIKLLTDHLSKEDYIHYFNQSDVILLPYNEPRYQKSSSNIFMEAVLSDSIPLVYPDTWMAYELSRFDLDELIIDWSPEHLSDKIVKLHQNKNIRDKLAKLKKKYSEFHTIDSYGQTMLHLANADSL